MIRGRKAYEELGSEFVLRHDLSVGDCDSDGEEAVDRYHYQAL